jgi:hypothetical protein
MTTEEYWDRFFGAGLDEVDPDIDLIIDLEEERQARKLIMIPSESAAPKACGRRWAACSTTSTPRAIRPCA